MKKLLFLLVVAGAFMTAACDDADCCVPNVFDVTGQWEFLANGDLDVAPVIALPGGVNCDIISAPAWVLNYDDITDLELERNYGSDRDDVIVIKATNGDEATVRIVQYGPMGFSVSPTTNMDYDALGKWGVTKSATHTITVTADFPWTAVAASATPGDWIVLSTAGEATSRVVVVTLLENEAAAGRSGTITFTEDNPTGTPVVITFNQEGYEAFFEGSIVDLRNDILDLAAVAIAEYQDNALRPSGPSTNIIGPGIYTSGTYTDALAIILLEPGTTFVSNGKTVTVVGWAPAVPLAAAPPSWGPLTPGITYWGVFNWHPGTYPAVVPGWNYYYGLYCYNGAGATSITLNVTLSYVGGSGTTITETVPMVFTWP
ncbi:MAG: BACON domain-containing protein [Bacteroidales bacterium]|nr:BACON domain-containing protein [Bacteroidales bacterium]